ncbi:MAG TPA: ATP-binding cassette domain-containing protein [Ferruginibacter sp.]|nr:ATP-binding cassette domain-containing protein [Ferruginibacter sp.]
MPITKNPVARILNLVALEKKEITSIYFYAILKGLIQLSLPLGVQTIVGFVLGASMRASLVVLIALVVAGVLAAGLMKVNQMKIIEKIQQKIFVRYSFAFAQHLPKLDLRQADHYYLPELVNRFFDIPVLQKSLSKILLDIPAATIQIISGLLLLSLYHPAFILFGFILIVLLWLILRFTGKHALQTSIEESTYKYKVAAWLEEIARVIKSLKLSKPTELYLQKTDEQVTRYLDARNRHFRILLLQYNVLVLFKTIITAAMLIVGTLLLVNQQLNIGQFIAAEIIILLVLSSVEKLIMNLGSVYDTLTSVEKIANLTDKPVEKDGTVILTGNNLGLGLEMNNLSFGYDGETDVLHDVSLQINAGEKVCIRGSESSGKSTLLRLMAGAYSGFRGNLLINSLPVTNYKQSSLRSQIGVLLNQQDIFYGTLVENIHMGNTSISMDTIMEYASKTGLSGFISTLKDGYDTLLDPTGKRLSRNVIHKILLVRALVGNPRLILLEEPWINSENENRNRLIELLRELKNTTLVVVTNDEGFAEACDKIITIEKGNVTVSQTKNNPS